MIPLLLLLVKSGHWSKSQLRFMSLLDKIKDLINHSFQKKQKNKKNKKNKLKNSLTPICKFSTQGIMNTPILKTIGSLFQRQLPLSYSLLSALKKLNFYVASIFITFKMKKVIQLLSNYTVIQNEQRLMWQLQLSVSVFLGSTIKCLTRQL